MGKMLNGNVTDPETSVYSIYLGGSQSEDEALSM